MDDQLKKALKDIDMLRSALVELLNVDKVTGISEELMLKTLYLHVINMCQKEENERLAKQKVLNGIQALILTLPSLEKPLDIVTH